MAGTGALVVSQVPDQLVAKLVAHPRDHA